MTLTKCPRCELNYILDGEQYCKICRMEMKGEPVRDEIEMCTVCGEHPVMPGKDVCLSCLKEMQSGGSRDDVEDAPVSVDESTIGLNSVSTMDEIIPEIEEDIPANEYGDIQNELSLESVIEDENEDDDEDKDDDDR